MTFRLGESEFVLEVTMRAAMQYERQTGRSFFADAQSIAERPTAEATVGLLWAAMLHHAPDLSLDEVAAKISLSDLPRVAEALREAYAVPFAQQAGQGGADAAREPSP